MTIQVSIDGGVTYADVPSASTYQFRVVDSGGNPDALIAANAKIAALTTELNASKSKVVTLTTEVNALKVKVTTLTAANAALQKLLDEANIPPPPPPPPVGDESPDLTNVPPATQIVDRVGSVWTLSAGKQVVRDGVVFTNTANVGELFYKSGRVYQGSVGRWWFYTGTGWQMSASPKA